MGDPRGGVICAGGRHPRRRALQIETTLAQEGHTVDVVGREKHLYSIYKKMKAKRKSFAEIMDIYAFRIIVDR